MGAIRTIGATTAVKGTPTPVLFAAADYPGVVIPAVSFTILNGIATIFLNVTDATGGVFPTNGYNGGNGYPEQNATTGSQFDIHGPNSGNGQQVTLWGFTTGTYFNGKVVTVLDNNPKAGYFRFVFEHANVSNADDAGNTAPAPVEHHRAVRLEISQAAGTDIIYVGDLNVSDTQYMTALTLAGQSSITIASENIPIERIFIDTSGTSDNDNIQVSPLY